MRSIVSRYILNIQYTSNQRYDICWKTSWFNWCNWWFHKTATDVGWIYLWMIYDARSMTMMYDVRWKEWTHFMNTAVRSLINCQHSGSWSLDIMKELISRWWFQGDFLFSLLFWGRFPFWTNIFRRGWFNHQLDWYVWSIHLSHFATVTER